MAAALPTHLAGAGLPFLGARALPFELLFILSFARTVPLKALVVSSTVAVAAGKLAFLTGLLLLWILPRSISIKGLTVLSMQSVLC